MFTLIWFKCVKILIKIKFKILMMRSNTFFRNLKVFFSSSYFIWLLLLLFMKYDEWISLFLMFFLRRLCLVMKKLSRMSIHGIIWWFIWGFLVSLIGPLSYLDVTLSFIIIIIIIVYIMRRLRWELLISSKNS